MAALQRLKHHDVDALLAWYEKNQRDFPWRKNPEPYWVWLAEIMSQQTVMAALLPYFYRFIEKFPTVKNLALAHEDEVLKAWTGLGYYSRARNVHKAAKTIHAAKGFPKTLGGWLELPGVGPYTAAAVVSQCFNVEEPVWDGNVTRVTSRLDARLDIWSTAYRAEMLDSLREKMVGHNPSYFNQSLMELGATVCTPKSPSCTRCPIQRACTAFKKNAVGEYPPPKPRKKNIELRCRVVVPLRERGQSFEVWLTRRPEPFWFAGMWDFPSELGGVASSVIPLKILATKSATEFGVVRHQITHHKITLVGIVDQAACVVGDGRWLSIDELLSDQSTVPLSTTARKVLKLLMAKSHVSLPTLCLNTN